MKNILIMLSLSAFLSCQKSVEFKVDVEANKLVINSYIDNEKGINAKVTLSKDPLASITNFETVNDATIKLYKNNTFLSNLNYDIDYQNYFLDNGIINATNGDVFKIEVSAPDRESVSAEITIPTAEVVPTITMTDTALIPFVYFNYDSISYFIDTIIPMYKIEINFIDISTTNYYALNITFDDGAGNSSFVCFTSKDPVFSKNGSDINLGGSDTSEAYNTFCEEVNFTDETFINSDKKLVVYVPLVNTYLMPDPKFSISIEQLSDAYYKYRATSQLQINNSDNPFSQVVSIYTNISNGFGIFASKYISKIEVHL